jgi:hypothetical protein
MRIHAELFGSTGAMVTLIYRQNAASFTNQNHHHQHPAAHRSLLVSALYYVAHKMPRFLTEGTLSQSNDI